MYESVNAFQLNEFLLYNSYSIFMNQPTDLECLFWYEDVFNAFYNLHPTRSLL